MSRFLPIPLGVVLGLATGIASGVMGPDAVLSSARADDRSGPGGEQATDPVIAELIEAHNRERSEVDLPPLTFNPKLEAAARAHARDMAEHDRMSHEGSDGSKPSQRIKRRGYRFEKSGENVAEGQETVPAVMKSWMNSSPHKKNILGDFREIGAARATAEDDKPYWCVVFGKPFRVLDPDRAADQVLETLNRERAKRKQHPLRINSILQAAAQRHARDMAKHDQLLPKDDDGLSPLQRVEQQTRRFRRLGVLTASGQATPDEVVKTWLGDGSDRDDPLEAFREVGIGYAVSDEGPPYWSALFGQPAR